MKTWNIFNKTKPQNDYLFFQIVYQGDMAFGVTAESAHKAEELVCEEIFHNQTILGTPAIEVLDLQSDKK